MKATRPPAAGRTTRIQHFGIHLTLDGYLASRRKLDDLRLVSQALTELPERLRMERLIPPYVVRAPASGKKDPGGWTGFVIIQESHISVHTFPARRFVSIDVYSCKDFEPAPVISYFRRTFGIRKVEKHLIIRGTEYPVRDLP